MQLITGNLPRRGWAVETDKTETAEIALIRKILSKRKNFKSQFWTLPKNAVTEVARSNHASTCRYNRPSSMKEGTGSLTLCLNSFGWCECSFMHDFTVAYWLQNGECTDAPGSQRSGSIQASRACLQEGFSAYLSRSSCS
jgi:hypothetical protein